MLRVMREEDSKAGQYCQAAQEPLLGMLEVSLWSSQWEDVWLFSSSRALSLSFSVSELWRRQGKAECLLYLVLQIF